MTSIPILLFGLLILVSPVSRFSWAVEMMQENSLPPADQEIPVSNYSKEEIPEFVPGEILVRLKPQVYPQKSISPEGIALTGINSLDKLNSQFRAEAFEPVFKQPQIMQAGTEFKGLNDQTNTVKDLSRWQKIKVSEDEDIQSVIAAYRNDPNVETTEVNYILVTDLAPNDTFFAGEKLYQIIKSREAWDIYLGSPTVEIAIVDTGVDMNHPDLRDSIDTNLGYDFVDINLDAYISQGYEPIIGEDYIEPDNIPQDFYGHGTMVSGLAAASTNNQEGIASVSWGCRILPLRAGFAIKKSGRTYGLLELDDCVNAINYAVSRDAKVINMSWSFSYPSVILEEAINAAYASGAVLVASAGNRNSQQPNYPAYYDNVVAVAATGTGYAGIEDLDKKADFSSFGDWVDVCAPGTHIFSTHYDPVYGSTYGRTYGGTSFSGPQVAGLAGLILSGDNSLTNEEVINRILGSSDDINLFNLDYIGLLGAGRLNAYQALAGVNAPKLLIKKTTVNEIIGNNNGVLDWGEKVNLILRLKNLTHDAYRVRAKLSIYSTEFQPFIDLIKPEVSFEDIPRGGWRENNSDPFILELEPCFSLAGEKIIFSLDISSSPSQDSDAPVYDSTTYFILTTGQYVPGWSVEVLDNAVDQAGWYLDLDLDSLNQPRIVYGSNANLYYGYFNGLSWQKKLVGNEAAVWPLLRLDSQDRPHLIYLVSDGTGGGQLKHAFLRNNTDAWAIDLIDSEINGNILDSSLALDNLDICRISYNIFDQQPRLKYAFYDGLTWNKETVDNLNCFEPTSIAIDKNGLPAIAYITSGNLRYAHYNGLTWQIEDVSAAINGTYLDCHLKFDSQNLPHIGYTTGHYDNKLKYAFYDGTTWTIETVLDNIWDPDFIFDFSLDSQGAPCFSYYRIGNDSLRLVRKVNSQWQTSEADSGCISGYNCSLVTDSSGGIHVAYFGCFNKLKHAYYGPLHTAPVICPVSNQEALVGAPFTISLFAYDPDPQDSIRLYVENLPVWLNAAPEDGNPAKLTLSGTPRPQDTGIVFNITINAQDKEGLLTTRTMAIKVRRLCGDVNGDAVINICDVTYLNNFLYRHGPGPAPLLSGDVNADQRVDKLDIIYLTNYLFNHGPGPLCHRLNLVPAPDIR
ncbi:MAG: S8 family serine peptidase [Candidatus Omnitrophota bacterium]